MEEGKTPLTIRPNIEGGVQPIENPKPRIRQAGRENITGKFFDAIISISLVALFLGFPIFFTGMTFQGIAFEKQLYFYFWLLVGLVSWVSKGVMQGELRVRRTPLDIPILLFVAGYGISAAFSIDRWHSAWGVFGDPSRGFLSIAALALAYYLIVSHFTPKRFHWMFGSLVVSSFVVVLWSVLALMGVQFLPGSIALYAPISLTGTISTLATFLAVTPMIFLTAIFAAFRGAEGKKSLLAWSIMIFASLGLLGALFLIAALYPYMAWPALLGGLGFFLIFILAQIVRPPERWVWMPMVVFVAVLSFLMVGRMDIARVNLPVEVLPKLSFAWDIAKSTVGDGHFLFGVGPANYSYAFSMYRPVEYNNNALYTLGFDQGPGLLLEAIPTLGVLGTVLFLVLAFSFLSIGIYLLTSDKSKNKIFSLGLWGASIVFFIASFMAAFNGALLVTGVLVATLAIAALLWESGSEDRYLSLSLKASPKFALALAFIFMVVSAGVAFLFTFIGKVFIADISAGGVLREQTANEQSLAKLGRASELYTKEPRYLVRLSQTYMILANEEAAKPEAEVDARKVVNYIREAIAVMERAADIAPNDARVAEALGLIYENSSLYAKDALPKAFDAYEKALSLEPNNPLLLVKLGTIKRAMGDSKEGGDEQMALYGEAKEFFETAIEKKADLPLAHYNLAVVLSRMKEYDAAIAEASESVALEPGNVTYAYGLGSLYQARGTGDDYDKAKTMFENILKSNEKLVDVRLALGILYEQRKDRDAALTEYRKILELLPEGVQGDTIRKQVDTFIRNLESGRGNIATNEPEPAPAPAAPASETIPAQQTLEPNPAANPEIPLEPVPASTEGEPVE